MPLRTRCVLVEILPAAVGPSSKLGLLFRDCSMRSDYANEYSRTRVWYSSTQVDAHISLLCLREQIARHVKGDDDVFLQAVAQARPEKSNAVSILVDDPIFEAAYEQLDQDDRKEFEEARIPGIGRWWTVRLKLRTFSDNSRAIATHREPFESNQVKLHVGIALPHDHSPPTRSTRGGAAPLCSHL